MMDSTTALAPPGRLSLLLETRTAIDLARMLVPLAGAQMRAASAPAPTTPVLVLPGFGTDDRVMAPLRHDLTRRGYAAEGWGMGRNLAGVNLRHRLEDISAAWDIEARQDYRGEGGVPYLCERFVERVRVRHEALGRPITLLGWSLGGYIAREAARELPGIVDRVITLGAPTIGGPKYTMAARFFRQRGMDLDWIEDVVRSREARPIRQPITAIYSRSDAIVTWRAAIDHHSPDVRHVEVSAAHLGMVFQPEVWSHVVEALAPSV